MKLRFQLAFLVVLAIVASLGAAMFFTLKLTRAQLEANARVAASDAEEEIQHDLEKLPPVTDERIEKELEKALRTHRRVTGVELVLADGDKSRQYSLHTKSERLAIKDATPTPLHVGPRTLSATLGEAGARGIEVSASLSDRSRIGAGRLIVTSSLEAVDKLLETQANVTLWVAAIAVLLASLFTAFIADGILGRPLARLASAMGDVSEGALDRRVKVDGPQEVRRVSEAFNRMLERLQEADRAIRTFNERLASEVHAATAALSDRNASLNHLNVLLVRAREDLSHKERLAALGQLAAQLAHEVGTPLGSVSGHLQLALASPDCPPSVRDRLVIASQEITRVSRIIRDYLDSTRRIDPEVSDVSVEQIIHEAVEVARGGNATRTAPVSVEVAVEAGQWRTDEGVTRQILVNLVANALDAVASVKDVDTGAVAVRAQLEEGRKASELVLRVSDNGPGMGPEALGRMFEPFYTTKGRGKGTGLGLAICRELAQGLGGKIEGVSEPGRGTTFTIRVPNGDEVARRAQAAAGAKQLAPTVH